MLILLLSFYVFDYSYQEYLKTFNQNSPGSSNDDYYNRTVANMSFPPVK
jgi:hypothetical protein